MKWGTAYSADYVNRLDSMLQRHTNRPTRLTCLTDNDAGIRPGIRCLPCPEVAVPGPKRNRGWRKVALWDSAPDQLHGPILFLDLDLVITGNIDVFFDYKPDSDFVVIRNWTQPQQRIGNTSAYRFHVGSHPEILRKLEADPQSILKSFPNSQTFISHCLHNTIEFWPEEWCSSFKRHCVPRGLRRWWIPPTVPQNARIIAFPGTPKPHQAINGEWPAPWYKKFYKTMRLPTWIAEEWRNEQTGECSLKSELA